MAKLILSLDGLAIKEIQIDKDKLSLGRRPHNDIHIDNLAVSGEHAAITRHGTEITLEDLGSTNGTVVNGIAVQRHVLKMNDLVTIGKYTLKFIADDDGDQFEKTMLIRSPSTAPISTPVVEEISKPAVLQILNGSNAGKELALTKNLTSIGKPSVQVAVIVKRQQGYFITHVEGLSRPAVNGAVIPTQTHPLQDHDIIELSGVKMEFYYKA